MNRPKPKRALTRCPGCHADLPGVCESCRSCGAIIERRPPAKPTQDKIKKRKTKAPHAPSKPSPTKAARQSLLGIFTRPHPRKVSGDLPGLGKKT